MTAEDLKSSKSDVSSARVETRRRPNVQIRVSRRRFMIRAYKDFSQRNNLRAPFVAEGLTEEENFHGRDYGRPVRLVRKTQDREAKVHLLDLDLTEHIFWLAIGGNGWLIW